MYRQTAHLGQGHARQRQSVVNLRQVDLGGVEFDIYCELVAFGGHALFDHQTDVVAESVKQIDIAHSEFLLCLKRDHLPVGGIDGVDDILRRVVVHGCGKLFGIAGYLVHRHDLSAHENRLGEGDGAEKHVVQVIAQSFFGQIGHL